ncbi:MAG: hypothetical protein RIC30_07590 [Marinoscillum sp.]|uniref:hypothetical protein n=1 Tax=Marinoscillum sp. TaxID=2024838 RepID=UPI0032F66D98
MKKLFTFSIALLLAQAIYSQGITAKSYMEQTKIGNKLGTAIGYTFPCKVEVGGFYQKTADFMNAQEITERFYEKEFTGMYINLPLKHYSKLTFDLNVRTGAVNGQNFAITPSLLGSYSPVNAIKLGLGVGTRMFRPTLQAAVSIKLGKLK